MLFVLSPAKSLDHDAPTPTAVAQLATAPQFIEHLVELIGLLKKLSAADVAASMDLSEAALATLNVERYASWSPHFEATNSKPAALAFNGDVYGGLDAPSLSATDLRWAQDHIAILSGLHGVLRPLDRLRDGRAATERARRRPLRLLGRRDRRTPGRARCGRCLAGHLQPRV